jgi:hypothetical protein
MYSEPYPRRETRRSGNPVAVAVADCGGHRAGGLAQGVERDAPLQGLVVKMAVAVIDEQHVRGRVVADIEVLMAVPVVIQRAARTWSDGAGGPRCPHDSLALVKVPSPLLI